MKKIMGLKIDRKTVFYQEHAVREVRV